jgi:hypothetical protein
MDRNNQPQQPRGQGIEPEAGGILHLARLCAAQLDRELAHLETVRDLLKQVYAAAVASKPQGLADLLERQKGVAEAAADVRAERDRFRAEAGAVLGLPADAVTVR